jgi:uncharacterized protein
VLRGEAFGKVVRWVVRRQVPVIAVACLLAAAGAALALRSEVSASIGTLVDPGSDAYQASERYKAEFGEDPVAILVKGNLQRTVLTPDLGRVLALEGCLSGNLPPESLPDMPAPCRELARSSPVKAVYGPGTFINTAAAQLNEGFQRRQAGAAAAAEQAAKQSEAAARKQGASRAQARRSGDAARELVQTEFRKQVIQIGLRYGLTALPTVDNPQFVSQLVFDTSQGAGRPKSRFASIFPSSNAAVIQVRLRSQLTEAERTRAIELVERAVAEPRFGLEQGGRYVVTGAPVVVEGLAEAVKRSAFVLLAAALLVMAGTLALVFRTRLRLLPLGVAGGAAALTFGAVSLVGGSLTMASIAALPVLIGLAVDYAIQLQARFDEARAGAGPAADEPAAAGPAPPARTPEQSAVAAAVAGGPTIASAALATGAGFLVLLLSPVPMVRGFGLIIIVGIALAFACALTAGFATLARYSERRPRPADLPPVLPRTRAFLAGGRARVASVGGAAQARSRARSLRIGARTRHAGAGARERSRRAVAYALARPARVLGVGLAVAVIGWAADTQQRVVSDIRELVPQDLPALQAAQTLERETGVSGELDVTVRSEQLTDPAVIAWMSEFQDEVLVENGYRPGEACGEGGSRLCPAFSLPELLRTVSLTDRAGVEQLLDAIPPYFSQAVIAPDRKTASMAFGIPLMPLDEQAEVIEGIERRLEDAPLGVETAVVGLPVLAAAGNEALSSPWRRLGTLLAGLVAVFAVLLLVRRRLEGAAVPLIPIALATGWSALLLFVLRIPLNPLSASLGALVLAISTEFSVLLSARYEQERAAGATPAQAVERTYRSTGAAVLASGVTAIAGFAVLIASDIRMLRDFGAVTAIDLSVSLAGVMLVLPAALVWAEAHGPLRWRDLDPRRWGPPAARGLGAGAREAFAALRRLPGALRREPRAMRRAAAGGRSRLQRLRGRLGSRSGDDEPRPRARRRPFSRRTRA